MIKLDWKQKDLLCQTLYVQRTIFDILYSIFTAPSSFVQLSSIFFFTKQSVRIKNKRVHEVQDITDGWPSDVAGRQSYEAQQ